MYIQPLIKPQVDRLSVLINPRIYQLINNCHHVLKYSLSISAVVLSPRKYASADQIHALFTSAPPRPQSAYSKHRSDGSHRTRSTPSDKGKCKNYITWAFTRGNLFHACANNKSAERHVNMRSLIKAYVVRFLNSFVSISIV